MVSSEEALGMLRKEERPAEVQSKQEWSDILKAGLNNKDLKYPLLRKMSEKKQKIVDHIINIESRIHCLNN